MGIMDKENPGKIFPAVQLDPKFKDVDVQLRIVQVPIPWSASTNSCIEGWRTLWTTLDSPSTFWSSSRIYIPFQNTGHNFYSSGCHSFQVLQLQRNISLIFHSARKDSLNWEELTWDLKTSKRWKERSLEPFWALPMKFSDPSTLVSSLSFHSAIQRIVSLLSGKNTTKLLCLWNIQLGTEEVVPIHVQEMLSVSISLFLQLLTSSVIGENTVLSFLTAAQFGAEYVEMDVQLTSDNCPVWFCCSSLL